MSEGKHEVDEIREEKDIAERVLHPCQLMYLENVTRTGSDRSIVADDISVIRARKGRRERTS